MGIATAPVTRQNVSPRRTLGGEAMVPVGRTIIVSTPVSGLVASPGSRELPLPGTHVTAGTEVLSLVPLLSPERDVPTPAEQVQMVGAQANLVAAQTVALGDIERSAAEVDAAKITLQRAQKLFHDRAGAKRLVDDAEAQLNIAQSVWSAAQQREKQLSELMETLKKPGSGGGGELQSGGAVALPMLSPIEGLINRLNVSQGQTVAAGTALFEVINSRRDLDSRAGVCRSLSLDRERTTCQFGLTLRRSTWRPSPSEAIVARPIAAATDGPTRRHPPPTCIMKSITARFTCDQGNALE
ncbi:MAG: hypothetical protein R3C56_36555 [Pirellulaceae bacterium]